jgi:GH15 family glucan-1,4-alpha-glucosidase
MNGGEEGSPRAPPAPGPPVRRPAARVIPINAYGVIGNLHTAVLIAPDGSIDWACLPRFAAPSVFARILDEERGGLHEVGPVEPASSAMEYLPSTNVLLTRHRLADGRALEVTDFMPLLEEGGDGGAALIVRRLEARGGPLRVRVRCRPRFAYGVRSAVWTVRGREAIGAGEHERLWVGLPGPAVARDGTAETTVPLLPGRPRVTEIAWGTGRPDAPGAEELLERTTEHWRRWRHADSSAFHLQASPWHRWVERSELVLKLLSRATTGAFVAAPTTSLPEWPGGGRNWDYRYAWVRDAAFTSEALLMLGHVEEARRFLRWVVARGGMRGTRRRLRVLYGPHGETDLTERTLPHLRGYLGSRPVRVGNRAEEQFQLDIYGEVLDAAAMLFLLDRDAVQGIWPELRGLVEWVDRVWTRPDRGIWEVRGPPAQYVHSKLMAWVAFDRARSLAREFEGATGAQRWSVAADRVRADLLEHGYDRRLGCFVQQYGGSGMDAANLRIPLVGFLPPEDPRVGRTVARIEAELGPGPFLHRYRGADGLLGPEGAFLPCAFWLVECLARRGETERARAYFDRLTGAAGALDLFSEEYDPVAGRALGNYPQALTHIGVLRAALAVGRSSRTRRPPPARRPPPPLAPARAGRRGEAPTGGAA